MSTPGFSADTSLYTTRTQYRATSAWGHGMGVSPQQGGANLVHCTPPTCPPGGIQKCCILTQSGWQCSWHRCRIDPCSHCRTPEECCLCAGGTWTGHYCL